MGKKCTLPSGHLTFLDLNKLNVKYNSILQNRVKYTLFRTIHKYYERKGSAGRFLAQRAKLQFSQTVIPGIQNDRSELIKIFLNQITQVFK